MPRAEHLVLCGGAEPTQTESRRRLRLDLHGGTSNIRLTISDISRRLLRHIPDILTDLLEVASYVYAADAAIGRGGTTDSQMGSWWRRGLCFVIPVRRPEIWSSDEVSSALVETLSFLSDDQYTFKFQPLIDPPSLARYLEFGDDSAAAFSPDEIVLFSGGLDSLAGAISELAEFGRKIALISHRSASKIAAAQKHLVEQLRDRFGSDRLRHVPVWVYVDGALAREATHRTRSFLFAALGAVAARLFGRDRLLFFENGVVSFNLPLTAQVVGARATRTTHPQALAGFRRFLSALLQREFIVQNPFVWATKSELVQRISESGCGELIRNTRSCTRVHAMTVYNPHCGQCSQCLDRRFAVISAGQESQDPGEAYKVDLFSGSRSPGPDRELALAYVRSASNVFGMEDVAFFYSYGEVSRIIGFFDEPADQVAGRVLDLHRRHAARICEVFDAAIASHARALREGSLPADCLISLVVGQHGKTGAYPTSSRHEVENTVAGRDRDIRIAIDKERNLVVFHGWGEIKGVCAQLLIALSDSGRSPAGDAVPPEEYRFVGSRQLREQTKCDDEETFRRRVLNCRQQIERLAQKAGDLRPTTNAVIENLPWHGYRLNPDRVRVEPPSYPPRA